MKTFSRRILADRDILITDDGAPKISDYGIAKQLDRPVLGLTFQTFRSVPFTPPEEDSGEWSKTRDCFSWAAVAVFCLTGKIAPDYGALDTLTSELSADASPVAILQSALSNDPAERPPLASALLAELDEWSLEFSKRAQRRETCYLQI